jgi:predicted nuclease with TOPRIM domain
MMKEQIEKRLRELQSEYEAGQAMLADLDTRRAELEQTMSRISGAIEVLKELLTESGGSVEKG